MISHEVIGAKEAKATEQIDKTRILNSIAFPRLGTSELQDPQSSPIGHPNFQQVDKALASLFALSSWYGFILQGRDTETLARALSADPGRTLVQLSFTGCPRFSDDELQVLMSNLPGDLRILRLNLGFSGIETLDAFSSSPCLRSLVEVKLRFTGSASLRSVAGLGVALKEMEKLLSLELWCTEL